MTILIKQSLTRKVNNLRYVEYYNIQEELDKLYENSKQNKSFYNLMGLIASRENILLAYRTIKKNKGSNTKGVNKTNIIDIANNNIEDLITYVRKRLNNYFPHKVKRVFIPKSNGKLRPLGIPSIEDRLIQQCIKQILEPICEAKFYDYSFGFRPNRNTTHAIARCYHLAQRTETHYCVDIDIKSFFDNVNHGKLIKQMWTMGIRDKNLLKIISKILKAEIKDIGIQTKGTPQGGILSPLLSNIVLNELDWWIHSQFDGMKTHKNYSCKNSQDRALKNTTLKEIHIVRYADDFKIFCRSYNNAKRIKIAVTKWLKERLGLEVNEEKSTITNLRKNYTNFLGIKIKVHKKGFSTRTKKKKEKVKYTIKSHISNDRIDKTINNIKKKIKNIKSSNNIYKEINIYNSTILGLHNYFCMASHVSKDFQIIDYKLRKFRKNQLKSLKSKNGKIPKSIIKKYGKSKGFEYISGIGIIPIHYVQTKPPLQFKQEICNYTSNGRKLVHDNLNGLIEKNIHVLMKNPILNETVEYNDNRLSLYSSQKGLCYITKKWLELDDIECHHKTPRKLGGKDNYQNLVIISKRVHKLIHATKTKTIIKYLNLLNLNIEQIIEINKLRNKCNNKPIETMV